MEGFQERKEEGLGGMHFNDSSHVHIVWRGWSKRDISKGLHTAVPLVLLVLEPKGILGGRVVPREGAPNAARAELGSSLSLSLL